jgi:hypothetical protein
MWRPALCGLPLVARLHGAQPRLPNPLLTPRDRKANEEFVAQFFPSYCLYEQRIGAPSSVNLARGTRYESGAVLRILKVGKGQYCAHVMSADGTSQVNRGAAFADAVGMLRRGAG